MSPTLRALIKRQFQSYFANNFALFMMFVTPMFSFAVISFAITLEVKDIDVAIYNQDSGKHGHEITQRIKGSPYFKSVITKGSDAEISKALLEEEVFVSLVIPSDFSRKIAKHESSDIQVLLDGRRSNASLIAGGYIAEIVQQYNTELLKENPNLPPAPTIVQRNWFNPQLFYAWYTLPCLLALMGMTATFSLTTSSIVLERQFGTLDLLRVSPIHPYQVLLGKSIPVLFIALTQITFILFVTIFIYKIPFLGSYIMLYASLTIFLFAMIGIGLFFSSLATTGQQVGLLTFIYMAPSNILSGLNSPVENMPVFFQYVSELVPLKHIMIITRGLFLKDIPFSVVMENSWPNVLIGISTISAAIYTYKIKTE